MCCTGSLGTGRTSTTSERTGGPGRHERTRRVGEVVALERLVAGAARTRLKLRQLLDPHVARQPVEHRLGRIADEPAIEPSPRHGAHHHDAGIEAVRASPGSRAPGGRPSAAPARAAARVRHQPRNAAARELDGGLRRRHGGRGDVGVADDRHGGRDREHVQRMHMAAERPGEHFAVPQQLVIERCRLVVRVQRIDASRTSEPTSRAGSFTSSSGTAQSRIRCQSEPVNSVRSMRLWCTLCFTTRSGRVAATRASTISWNGVPHSASQMRWPASAPRASSSARARAGARHDRVVELLQGRRRRREIGRVQVLVVGHQQLEAAPKRVAQAPAPHRTRAVTRCRAPSARGCCEVRPRAPPQAGDGGPATAQA